MSIVWWRQSEVIDEIAKALVANMEIAAKVVEVDARHRLLAIREPEFGRAYRRVLALYRLTSTVERSHNIVEAKIGIPPGVKGGDYGFWIEIGSKTAPAHPWLRPALVSNLRYIQQLLVGQ